MFLGDGRGQTAVDLQLEQTEEMRSSLEEKREELQQLLEELQERLALSEDSRRTEEELSKELQQQVDAWFVGGAQEVLTLTQAPPAAPAASDRSSSAGFLQLDELQSDRSQKEPSVPGPSGAEELISSLTAEREQLRSQLQEQTERVRNRKPSEDVWRPFWSDGVVLSCSSSSLQAAETHALLQEDLQHHRQENAGLLEQKDSDVSAAPPLRRFPLCSMSDGPLHHLHLSRLRSCLEIFSGSERTWPPSPQRETS